MNMRTYVGVMISTIKDDCTRVFIAAKNGRLNVVKFLVLEANADPHKGNKVGSRA